MNVIQPEPNQTKPKRTDQTRPDQRSSHGNSLRMIYHAGAGRLHLNTHIFSTELSCVVYELASV